MLPCSDKNTHGSTHHPDAKHKPSQKSELEHHRRLLWNEHRFLAANSPAAGCKTACFFRQFFRSVLKADYFAMRHGFISVHLAPGSKFDFQKYIKRSLEDDFKVVVGIRALVQFLCSYSTLPLYALVTQMGSNMKKSVFDEQTSKALMNWHKNAMKKKNEGKKEPTPQTLGGSPSESPDNSPRVAHPHDKAIGHQSHEMDKANASTPEHAANIIASVDIRGEHPLPGDNGLQLGNRDLLTGP
ncbi:hypothetical protein F0562_029839 [Nyssa sinensis]|uniref:MLO-like protein n=1 Tax=Nyssa sinensis TaxID=561372 RepID=A0A5J5AWA8_9ASTE|nr:hypothetical protein F0562_029839 [Nyssa sinensis]